MKRVFWLAPALALSGCVAVGGAVTPLGGGVFTAGGGQVGTPLPANPPPGGFTNPDPGAIVIADPNQPSNAVLASIIGVAPGDIRSVYPADPVEGGQPGCWGVTTHASRLYPNVCP